MDEATDQVQRVAATGHAVNRKLLALCDGGPFGGPDAVGSALLRMPGVAGFLGATTTERAPIERAVTEQVRAYTRLRLVWSPCKAGTPSAGRTGQGQTSRGSSRVVA